MDNFGGWDHRWHGGDQPRHREYDRLPYTLARWRRDRLPPTLWKYPDSARAWTVRVPRDQQRHGTALIGSITLSVAPSGPNELQVSALSCTGDDVTFIASGGRPRRTYTLKFLAALVDGQTLEFVEDMGVLPLLTSDRAAPPASWLFGAEIVWNFAPGLNFTQPRNAVLRLQGWN